MEVRLDRRELPLVPNHGTGCAGLRNVSYRTRSTETGMEPQRSHERPAAARKGGGRVMDPLDYPLVISRRRPLWPSRHLVEISTPGTRMFL